MAESASALHADLGDLLGQTISDRYRVDKLIATGGVGAVFHGHHLELHRDIAIKVLHPRFARDKETSARFDREARSVSRLDHRNCVRVTDYGTTDDGMKFMVMQLLEGTELGAMLKNPLSPARAAGYALQVFRGLEHAHGQGVVHRDIKPENILVTRDDAGNDILKLVDFGIARIVAGKGADERLSKFGIVFGTPHYMSPEQASGMRADERSDLYSAGLVLYQMLAAKRAFESSDQVELLRQQVSDPPPPLGEGVPAALAHIVYKLLAKERDDRYQDAASVCDALEVVLPDLEQAALKETTSLDVTGKSEPRERSQGLGWRLVVGGGVLAGLVGFAVYQMSAVENDAGPVPGDPVQADPKPVSVDTAGVSGERLADIDRLLMAGRQREAVRAITTLLESFPDDARLIWRHARALADQRGKKVEALARYGDAIDKDPMLLEDRDFYAEIMEVMRDPRLERRALRFALAKMGDHGHKFLLGLINREQDVLSYEIRHAILDEVANNEQSLALVNRKHNYTMDLVQIDASPTPCRTFSSALDAIRGELAADDLAQLRKVRVPKAGKRSDDAERAACDGLRKRHAEIVAELERKGG